MKNVFLITDPNSDPDDLACMILLRTLVEKGKIKLCGVTACKGNVETRQLRAGFSRAVLDALDMRDVPVAVGGAYQCKQGFADDCFYLGAEVQELLATASGCSNSSYELMEKVFGNFDKVTLLIVSPMNDVADFIIRNPSLFKQKVEKIVIMGGGDVLTGRPDEKSYNNAVCYEAALDLWLFAVEHNIPLIWVPRETVYQVQVGRDFYDEIAEISHLLARVLLNSNKKLFEVLWKNIQSGCLSHFDISRFEKVFLGSENGDITAEDDFNSVWAKIRCFNLYDPVTALVLDDEIFNKCGYFDICEQNKNVLIARIKDADALRAHLYDEIIGHLKKITEGKSCV